MHTSKNRDAHPNHDHPGARAIGDRRWPLRLLCVGLVPLALACGDNLRPRPGASPMDQPDASTVDAMTSVDAGVQCPSQETTACSDTSPCADADEDCVAGVCVATCGQDISGLAAALGDDITVLGNLCVTPALDGVHLGETDGCEVITAYSLTSETDSNGDLGFTLTRFTLEANMPMPAESPVGSVTVDIPDGVSAFAGSYLAIAPGPAGNDTALFGYTTSAAGFAGEVVALDTGDGTSDALSANGNFDVDWIDDSRYLINGQAADSAEDGQGLYVVDVSGAAPSATHVVTGLGDFSGSVAVDRERGLVFAGGVFSDGFVNRVFVIPLTEIEAAVSSGTPLDASGTTAIERFEIPSSFEIVADSFISFDFGTSEFHARSFTIGGDDSVTVGSPALFVQSPFNGVTAIGSDRALLHHSGGSLLIWFTP